jgi:soluble lytic murein transglycosylase-like protein
LPFPTPTSFSVDFPGGQAASFDAPDLLVSAMDPAVRTAVHTIDVFLKLYQVNERQRGRVAKSIVTSARKYDLDPKLVASISMVESRGNPFAISNRHSVGIMQINLPTWGPEADKEGVNLFKIEDNIDFGVRILKNYIRQYGLWEGVKRYKGWNEDSPESLQSVEEYLSKVQHVYGYEKPSEPQLLQ